MFLDRFFRHPEPEQNATGELSTTPALTVIAAEAAKKSNQDTPSVAAGMLCPMPGCFKWEEESFGAYSDFERDAGSTGI